MTVAQTLLLPRSDDRSMRSLASRGADLEGVPGAIIEFPFTNEEVSHAFASEPLPCLGRSVRARGILVGPVARNQGRGIAGCRPWLQGKVADHNVFGRRGNRGCVS